MHFSESVIPPEYLQQMRHKHEVKLEAPDECIYILGSYFFEPQLPRLPTMEKYREFNFHPPEDHLRETYEYYKKALQCIYYQGKDEASC